MASGKHPDYETNRAICQPVAIAEEHQQDAAATLDGFLASRKHANRPVRKYTTQQQVAEQSQGSCGNARLEALRQRVVSRIQASNAAQ